jgi:hypothetical protein
MRGSGFRALGISMMAGAAYDWAFALGILAFPAFSASTLGLALPPDPVYLRLNAIFLLLLGGIYLVAGAAPERHQGVISVAAAGRLLGAAFLTQAWWAGRPAAFLWLGLADLAFALAHAGLLLRARRSP